MVCTHEAKLKYKLPCCADSEPLSLGHCLELWASLTLSALMRPSTRSFASHTEEKLENDSSLITRNLPPSPTTSCTVMPLSSPERRGLCEEDPRTSHEPPSHQWLRRGSQRDPDALKCNLSLLLFVTHRTKSQRKGCMHAPSLMCEHQGTKSGIL